MSDPDRWATWGAARDGARMLLNRRQKLGLLAVTVLSVALLLLNPLPVLIGFVGLVTALYFVNGLYKVWLLVRGDHAQAHTSAAPTAVADRDLPLYTILVPLYHEGTILPSLIERLQKLDYPTDRLEVLLLVELEDDETQRALANARPPAHMHPIVMPAGQPRTKPRALNVGLHHAHGEHIVIYDAEDHPEPDQLRKAVAAFRAFSERVVCVQARLNFYNRYQSLLARLFAVDYAVWYDQMLQGLTRSAAFVPLGGTSNHFRVAVLHQLGGWDPFNVTEDCDLGARLGRAGLRVEMLDSITWEEAVTTMRPWIRQRSRWIKGYLQTYLVHMRHPLRLWREIGPMGFLDFQMLVGGSTIVLLLNPLMWALTTAYVLGRGTPLDTVIEMLFPAALYYAALLSFTAGNFLFFYINAYVCVRHDYIDLTRYALLTPLYWILLSVGAWVGFWSLVSRPYYWAKTQHGVSLGQNTYGPIAVAGSTSGDR
jgi:cellulose synthase/poly-beta-1,6-N-acetylglucosamine synthase-like glycosyltransferase